MLYNFFQVADIWWHGIKQRVLFEIHRWVWLVEPEQQKHKAPAWFVRVYPSWSWVIHLDRNDRPTHQWLVNYFHAAKTLGVTWFDRLKNTAVQDAANWVWSWTGGPRHGYPTLADWLEATWTWVQSELPDWIWQVSRAITTAYNGLKDWARTRYDAFRVLAQNGWNWIIGPGSLLSAWYNQVGTWIAEFKANPSGVILGVLGSTWARLVTFDQGPLGYYYQIWDSYWEKLDAFLEDPLGYLWNRVEDFLLRKW